MEFSHSGAGSAKDVAAGLVAKRAELEAGADSRGRALVGASIGATQGLLKGVADDAQATVTVQVSERTEGGKLVVSQLYLDCTIIPAPTGDPAPSAPADAAPAPAAQG